MDPGDYLPNHFSLLLQINELSQGALIANSFLIGFLLVCCALLSGSETAFFSLGIAELNLLRKNYKSTAYKIINLLEHPRKLLATILIANSFVNIGVAISSYTLISSYIDVEQHRLLGLLIEVVAVTFVLVLFGEVLPKVYAAQHNIRVALVMSAPLALLQKLVYPLSAFLVSFTNIIEKRLSSKKTEVNVEEINHAIDIAVDHKANKQEVSILKGIIKFGNIIVRHIMKARTDIIAADYTLNFSELLAFVKEAGYSRIPVYIDDIDTIKGVLFTKDLIEHLDKPSTFNWHELIRPAFFVPEQKKIDELLREFQQKRNHLAIVVDEYGGTQGLVTLEDIMEEIIGDIKDEFDESDDRFMRIDENNVVLDGRYLINDMCQVLNLPTTQFDTVKGESDTVAGLMLELIGRIPKVNDFVVHEQFKFTATQVVKMRIAKVMVTILQPTAQAPVVKK